MTETRATYGPQARYKITLTYHLTYPGEQTVTTIDDELLIEQTTATEAAMLAIAQLERFKPKRAIVTNLRLTVSLDL